jgi:dihydrofolate reductase
MAMSLDGFIAGPNNEDGGLHDWYFAPAGNAIFVIDELIQEIGAMILGNHVFGNEPEGWDTPYKVPHFVLTHTPRNPIERGGMAFHFVTDGIEDALARAKAAAGEKITCVAGGASMAQQFLSAGLVDELQIHLVPVLMGGGLRLFDHLGSTKLEQTRVLESPGVTHLRYRVMK